MNDKKGFIISIALMVISACSVLLLFLKSTEFMFLMRWMFSHKDITRLIRFLSHSRPALILQFVLFIVAVLVFIISLIRLIFSNRDGDIEGAYDSYRGRQESYSQDSDLSLDQFGNYSGTRERVVKNPNGSYSWTCSIDLDFYKNNMALGFKACIGIAVFIILFGLFLSFSYHDWWAMLIVVGTAAVFMGISALVFWLFTHFAKDPKESYQMWDTFVQSGYGKSSIIFDYKNAKTLILGKNYLILKGKISKIRVYVPADDMDFVKDFIMSRIPDTAEIHYD